LAEPGPSLPETPTRRLRVVSPNGTAQEITLSGRSQTVVKVHLLPHESRIRLQCLDRPTASPVADGDLRPCLVMISCVHIRPQKEQAGKSTVRLFHSRHDRYLCFRWSNPSPGFLRYPRVRWNEGSYLSPGCPKFQTTVVRKEE